MDLKVREWVKKRMCYSYTYTFKRKMKKKPYKNQTYDRDNISKTQFSSPQYISFGFKKRVIQAAAPFSTLNETLI